MATETVTFDFTIDIPILIYSNINIPILIFPILIFHIYIFERKKAIGVMAKSMNPKVRAKRVPKLLVMMH